MPTPKPASARKAAGTSAASAAEKATATGKATKGAPADAAPASALAPETLARTLRAVADELERDPALARRVAAAIGASPSGGDSGGNAPPTAPALDIPSPARGSTGGNGSKAAKPARAFKPTLVTGAGPELGTGVIDPYALRTRLGEDGLRRALGELRLGSLRAIIREHRLDPTGKLTGVNDADRLRNLIAQAVAG